MSPAAATDGVTPIFPLKTGDLFSHRYKVMTFFSSSQLPSSDIVLSSVLCKFSPFFHLGVTPWMVSPAGPPPLLTSLDRSSVSRTTALMTLTTDVKANDTYLSLKASPHGHESRTMYKRYKLEVHVNSCFYL